MDKRSLYRVNYADNNGVMHSLLICALTGDEAAAFAGVASAPGVQITTDRYPVEVAGLDAPHALVIGPPVTVAPFDLPKSVSRDEFNALQQKFNDLLAQMSAAPVRTAK